MKFSVVTISFNQAEFLERTILSVVRQKCDELEYIIVDPGSTDGSRDIIERYRSYFSKIIYDKDRGAADGLNRAFVFATGDIYCYLNSDDTLQPEAFVRVARFMQGHPEYDVICGHAWVTDRDDKRLRRVWSEPYRRIAVAYGAAVQIQPSTFIRRQAYIKSGGFNADNKSGWDGELLDELYLSGASIGIIDEFISTYRLHGGSITNSGRLLAQMKKGREVRFERLMQRPSLPYDKYVSLLFRLWKHMNSPLATWERIAHGPIFNRGVK